MTRAVVVGDLEHLSPGHAVPAVTHSLLNHQNQSLDNVFSNLAHSDSDFDEPAGAVASTIIVVSSSLVVSVTSLQLYPVFAETSRVPLKKHSAKKSNMASIKPEKTEEI